MSPNIWGPPTWCFFHTLAEKINPDMFNQLFPQIFNYIIRICRVLPCPDCSLHASQFLSKVNISGIKNKEDFKNLMCIFHNMVNRKKNKRQFYFENLPAIYDNKNIINVYNNFLKIYDAHKDCILFVRSYNHHTLNQYHHDNECMLSTKFQKVFARSHVVQPTLLLYRL